MERALANQRHCNPKFNRQWSAWITHSCCNLPIWLVLSPGYESFTHCINLPGKSPCRNIMYDKLYICCIIISPNGRSDRTMVVIICSPTRDCGINVSQSSTWYILLYTPASLLLYIILPCMFQKPSIKAYCKVKVNTKKLACK